MVQTSADDGAISLEHDRRQLEEKRLDFRRKRLFERFVMVPVSLGMLVAFFGYGALGIVEKIAGISTPGIRHEDARVAVLSVGAALVGLATELFYRRTHR